MDLSETFDTLGDKLTGWLDALILMLPNFAAAVVVVFIFWLLARLARKVLTSVMRRVSHYTQVNGLIASIGYLIILVTGVFIALGILNLDKTVTSLLAGVGIIGLALGFAFQDIAANFISGILLSLRRPFVEGDIVGTQDFLGVIDRITLRSTELRTFQGQIVIIPNKDVFQNPITNYSRLGKRRVDLACGVAYGDDLEKAKQVALKAVQDLDVIDRDRPVDLYYESFGESSIDFTLRFWVDFRKQTDFLSARSDAIMRIKRAFDENEITIPYPIRTLDFGVVGGEKLNEMLPASFYERDSRGGNNQ